jgi:dienelactone hydrolase
MHFVEELLFMRTHGIHGHFCEPEVAAGGVAALLIGGSEGGDASTRVIARRLAEAGIPALGLGYFKVPGCPDELATVPLEYFAAAVRWLRRRARSASTLAVIGTSRGSEAALLTACSFPVLVDAVVGIVPGNVVLCSWPAGRPAWLLDGEPLPFTSRFGPDAPAEAVIPIEQFPGPMLLISAGADEVWPSSAMATALELRAARRTTSSCTHLIYPTAGHDLARFLTDDPRPQRASAARDAWANLTAWLLGLQPPAHR